MTTFKRKILDQMLEWKQRYDGSTALLIEGARRVGKTFVAEQFGKEYYSTYIKVDFYNEGREIYNLFTRGVDLDYLFNMLSEYYHVKLIPRKSLIILDEVQLCPSARELIKRLVADGRFDYIETGSLISIYYNVKNILIPSGEHSIKMYPMDFEEFLWANGDTVSVPLMKQCFDTLTPLGPVAHKTLMSRYREYLIVGGMPEAVLEYVNSKSHIKVDETKKDILSLYRKDITRYARNKAVEAQNVFDNIPSQLSKKTKKFMLYSVSNGEKRASYRDAITWLDQAMIGIPCYNADDPSYGLSLYRDNLTMKLYMMDTGLLITQSFFDSNIFDNEIYQAILHDKLHINEGMIMENAVAQTFALSRENLYFFTRIAPDGKKNEIEIDFLLTGKDGKVFPVEVKSGSYHEHNSLDLFMKRYHGRIGQPYILYTKDIMVKDGIVHLPIYMAMFL